MCFKVYSSGVCVHEHNKPFPSHLVPLFQNESSCKNEFDIHENEPQGGTHFQKNGFALLTQAKTNSLRRTSITSGGESCPWSSCFVLWKPEISTCLMDLYVLTHTYLANEHPIACERVSNEATWRKRFGEWSRPGAKKTRSHGIFYPRPLMASSTCRRTVFSNLVPGQFPTECQPSHIWREMSL